MSTRRVVVTGMGIISPVGNDIARAWINIREGVSGIGPVTENDFTEFATRIAGEVRDFDVEEYMSMRDARRMDRVPLMFQNLQYVPYSYYNSSS